ncbi:BQ2448_4124 [Microbotryum intermedium]|uniref:BQ2448_4124 protein n=1 Tax=Microbotryum intermedium TaxID=269621 RepID=A0A238FH78_9BASI|nr:BQ2448_4124 [Microbotryum intermedium]
MASISSISSIVPVPVVETAAKAAARRLRQAAATNQAHQHSSTGLDDAAPSTASNSILDVALLPLVPYVLPGHALSEPIELLLLPHHLAPYLAESSPLTSTEKRTLFTSCFLRASSANNHDTLEWLLSIPRDPTLSHAENAANHRRRFSAAGNIALESLAATTSPHQEETQNLPDDAPRKWVDLEAVDQGGNTALVLAAALGHSESVRTLVEGGASVAQGDNAGWTPLHWAVQNNDLAIAAYLLNHRANPNAHSKKGLTPRDLISRNEDGKAMRDVLDSADAMANEREHEDSILEEDGSSETEEGRVMTSSASTVSDGRLPKATAPPLSATGLEAPWSGGIEKLEKDRKKMEAQKMMELIAETAMYLGLDAGLLGGKKFNDLKSASPTLQAQLSLDDSDSDSDVSPEFDWNGCSPDQMLVFTLEDLPILLDVIVTHFKPVRRRSQRIVPANALFLCARYAHRYGPPGLFEELLVGAMERIEAALHDRPDDMGVSLFWLSNSLLLLYYLRKDLRLYSATELLRVHLADLINVLFVFILRNAEQKIDKVLDMAILEYEGLPGLEDVDFEDEWRFVKKLTGRKSKKTGIVKSTSARTIFGGNDVTASPPRTSNSTQAPPATEATPATVTAILSSILFVLQIYDVPPSIIVQAFSQLFYWIACELFNRLLTQKKHLCRSRAMQVRLNASALEEWARSNHLPRRIVSLHFAPLNHLLQWLQCLSSETSVDGIIGTVQNLHALNPSQLLRAAKDYRYEVDETKIEPECIEYLKQIEKQWERVRIQKTMDEVINGSARALPPVQPPSRSKENRGVLDEGTDPDSSPELGRPPPLFPRPSTPVQRNNGVVTSASPQKAEAENLEQVTRMIDQVFSDPESFGSYTPAGAVEAFGELLNSKYMLPFALPTSADLLLHFDSPDAFGAFATPTWGSVAGSHSHAGSIADPTSPSKASNASTSAASDADSIIIRTAFAPVLPEEFFDLLDAAKRRARVGNNIDEDLACGWRARLPSSDDEEDEDAEEGYATSEKFDGERSYESVDVDATPRLPFSTTM